MIFEPHTLATCLMAGRSEVIRFSCANTSNMEGLFCPSPAVVVVVDVRWAPRSAAIAQGLP